MIPQKYKYLTQESGPKMLTEALSLYGILEGTGTANNPVILAWAKEVGESVANIYKADSIAWCGLFMAVVAKRAGKIVPKDPLWALNWGTFGKYVDVPMLGDVLVFTRKGGGHVGIYVGEGNDVFHVLGGNTGDQVKIAPILKSRLYTARRPDYTNQPTNLKRIKISNTGEISTNES